MREHYTEYIHTPGLFYPGTPEFVTVGDLPSKQGFISLYAVTKESASALVSAGTTKGFKGPVWSERLWIDVDTKGLGPDEAIERLNLVESILKELSLDYVAYDSGGNAVVGGGHFGVLREAEPSHTLPYQDKAWVQRVFGGLADTSIYTHLHLFRLPGTVHAVTGRRKVLVSQQSGKVLTLPPLLDIKGPALLTEFSGSVENGSIFSNFNIMANIGPRKNGERHAALVKLAYELRDHGVGPNQALFLLQENNKLFEEQKSESEISKIIRDIYSDPGQ